MKKLILIALLLFSSVSAYSHDIYMDLKQPNGTSCCHDQDCSVVEQWRDVKGGVEMFVFNQWVFVEENRVQRIYLAGDHSDSQAHWCGRSGYQNDLITFCAIVPPNGV